MDPDQRADELSDSPTVVQQSEEASAAAPQPESPRLGIIHLLAWTACVAAYWGTQRWLTLLAGLNSTVRVTIFGVVGDNNASQ